jgi:hypothetical protein
MRVKSKVESYGGLAHRLTEVFAKLKKAQLTIDTLRDQFPEDAGELARIRAGVVDAVANTGTAACRATNLVPKPSQPAESYTPISET